MIARDKAKRKVAVLGGGVGAISAAFELTSPLNPRHKEYDVTVYQMGGRLGGKGASGRNAHFHNRIEEHGLHIWMGWYHNAFRLIRECYDELDRSPSHPHASWRDAFKAHSLVTLMDRHEAEWRRWDITFPRTPDEPGRRHPSFRGQVSMLRGWFGAARRELKSRPQEGARFLEDIFGVRSPLGLIGTGIPEVLLLLRSISADRRTTASRCKRVRRTAVRIRSRVHAAVAAGDFSDDDMLRRITEMLDLLLTVVVGLIDEGVATGAATFNELDEMELREFLRKHGCQGSALDCAFLRCYYNLALAYRRGDGADPASENAAAGVAVNIMIRACAGYRGAFMWEMQSGMGDTIFAPYYEVLKRRGVKFEFFHRVRELGLSPDGQRVQDIRLDRQVDIVGGRYDPLIDVGGLDCWPSEPLYSQIVRGEALRTGRDGHPCNLDTEDGEPTTAGDVVLRAGEDFDDVILGIPVMAARICEQLGQADERWRAMASGVETVATQACQLWLRPPVEDLGWESPGDVRGQEGERTVLGAYAQPFHTWADFSHLAGSEGWPEDSRPRTVAYLLGTIPEDDEASSEALTAEGNSTYVQHEVAKWLSKHGEMLWPAFVSKERGPAWDFLVDHSERHGPARLSAQYHRANTRGSERYVQHTAGTTKYRLKGSESGFENLVLAGDWTDTGICGGCVETATMSGMQASRALSGYPRTVLGESSGPI